ncbi:MAG: hypothetical protein ACE5F1_00120 [Planctomycetota bacterium]
MIRSRTALTVLMVSIAGMATWGGASLILTEAEQEPGIDLWEGAETDETQEGLAAYDAVFSPVEAGQQDELPARERELAEAEDARALQTGARLLIAGRVVGKSGQPVKNAIVNLHMSRRGGFDFGANPDGRSRAFFRNRFRSRNIAKDLHTGADGRFQAEARVFAHAGFEITAQHASFAPAIVRRDWKLEPGTDPDEGKKLALEDIVLEAGATATGYVMTDRGVPLAGASVRYESNDWRKNRRLSELLPPARTDETGQFRMNDLPGGKFRLMGEAPKYVPAMSKGLELPAGARVDAVRITLSLGAELEGVVRNMQGKPIAGAEVRATASRRSKDFLKMLTELRKRAANPRQRANAMQAMRELQNQWRLAGRLRNLRAKTDAGGRFQLDGLPKGSLRLTVRHGSYIDGRLEPVEPARTPHVEVKLDRRLAVAGTVVDAVSNEPVEVFGLRQRTVRAFPGPRSPSSLLRGRSRRRPPGARAREAARRDAEAFRKIKQQRNAAKKRKARKLNPAQLEKLQEKRRREEARRLRREDERKRREADREARRIQRESYLKLRLGPSGIKPGWTPETKKHAGGEFRLEGLQPGSYVLDVSAPGYVKQAFGPYQLVKGQVHPPIRVRLTRGQSISGQVLDRKGGAAVAGARLELYLPPIEDRPRGNLSSIQQAMRPASNGTLLEVQRSDSEGRFRFSAMRPGLFRVRARAEGYSSRVAREVNLPAGRDVEKLIFSLGRAARVYGKVRNLEKGQRISLILASTAGARKVVPVDSKTGEYDARGLDAGSYFVRLLEQNRRGAMARYFTEAAINPGMQPDLRLGEGAERRFDLDAARSATGRLLGTVMVNGIPARGLEVRLREDRNGQSSIQSSQDNADRRLNRMLRRWLRASTNKNGKFEISAVPPGDYLLEVERRAGRNRGASLLYRESLRILESHTVRRPMNLLTGRLLFQVKDEKSGRSLKQGRVMMVLAHEARDVQPKAWRKLPSFITAEIRGGKARIAEMPAGEYQFFIAGGGIRPHTGKVHVGTGKSTPPQLVVVKRRPPKKKTPKKGKGKPGKQPGNLPRKGE